MWDVIVSVPDHCLSFYFTSNGTFRFALLFVLVFFSRFSVVITSFGEEGAGVCASRAFVSRLYV